MELCHIINPTIILPDYDGDQPDQGKAEYTGLQGKPVVIKVTNSSATPGETFKLFDPFNISGITDGPDINVSLTTSTLPTPGAPVNAFLGFISSAPGTNPFTISGTGTSLDNTYTYLAAEAANSIQLGSHVVSSIQTLYGTFTQVGTATTYTGWFTITPNIVGDTIVPVKAPEDNGYTAMKKLYAKKNPFFNRIRMAVNDKSQLDYQFAIQAYDENSRLTDNFTFIPSSAIVQEDNQNSIAEMGVEFLAIPNAVMSSSLDGNGGNGYNTMTFHTLGYVWDIKAK